MLGRIQNVGTIRDHLVDQRVAEGDFARQTMIADAIRRTGVFFTGETVERLRTVLVRDYPDKDLMAEQLEHLLLQGKWQDRLAEANAQANEEAEAAKVLEATSSSMDLVTERNPYGWAKPERKMRQDHGIPGEWNPYRQCFNLTDSERVAAAATDVRRRGCSRFEVLKCSDGGGWRPGTTPKAIPNPKAPGILYDQSEVDAAKTKFLAFPDQSASGVYGE